LTNLTLILVAGGAGCSRPVAEAPAAVKVVVDENRAYNDAARFLAGLPPAAGSPYTELTKTPAWLKYAGEMNVAWQTAEKKRLQPVREFQARELGGAAAKSNFVFYPFSGPDVLYMQGFYPNGVVYVLAGLERPGTILEPTDYDAENLDTQLNGIRQSSSSLFGRSFFITAEMSKQMRGQLVDGVLPVILMLLARTGNTIENVHYVGIDDAGKRVQMAGAQAKPGAQPDGLEILYHRDGEEKHRKLYYFRLDLGPGLDKNSSFLTFLSQFGKPETLIKSASFLLHYGPFSRLREYLLTNSTRIIQDDTGVRYEVFVKQGWKTRLYGDYTRPDRPFQGRYQKDLRAAFDEPGRAKPMGFSMGYGTGRRASHLVIAEHP
jgi:hypothetical protein